MVDPVYNGGSYCNPGYRGFIRVRAHGLWEFYYYLDNFDMHQLSGSVLPGEIPLYDDGGNAKAVNEKGEILEVTFPKPAPALRRGHDR